MPPVELKTESAHKGTPGINRPANLAFTGPRPPLGSSSTRMNQKQNPRDLLEGFTLPIRHGANPVASALGIRSGATPNGPIHPNIQPQHNPSQPDILTLPGLGHFYFALTAGDIALTLFQD